MGFYIETPEDQGKAKQLEELYGAQRILRPASVKAAPAGKIIVCVVSNPRFDAAGIAFSQEELDVFAAPDARRRTWMLMDRAKVIELVPAVAKFLEY